MHRVQKLLSNYGFCSRRRAEELIQEGRVKVNGRVVSIGESASEDDEILVDGRSVIMQKKVYLMFNKPLGCVTALNDKYHKTVMQYIHVKERVFPVGRLDYNTSGLLLVTNDGDFANNVMHPRYEITKTYIVETDKPITRRDIDAIRKGVRMEDGKTSPAKLKIIKQKVIQITIHEGKNRIIRRMLKNLGYSVLALKRTRIGNLPLAGLKSGECRELAKEDINRIFE